MANKRFPISLRELEVVAIHDVSPRLRRITFGGAQMGSFKSSGYAIPPFASEGPDDHVKMFFPAPDTGVLTLPTQADGHLNWPNDPRPTSREYTPRSFDPSSGTCDFEFVLHGHGIAGNWAASAKIGDTLHFAGPKSSFIIPSADWYLIVGDETALPAIGNWLEMLPSDAKVITVILHEDTSAQIPLQAPANAAIHWLLHHPAQPQTLRDTVANLTLPDGHGYVWGAGEREAIRRLRAHLIDERSLTKSQVAVSAYWHHGVDDTVVAKTYDAFDALADLAGPFALRAAATYDLAKHIANGATTIEALAAAADVELTYLRPLIPILIEKAVLAGTPEALSLAPLGLILLEDDHARAHLDYNSAPGRMDLAWFGLVATLKGTNAYAATHGQSYAKDAASDRFASNYADEHGHNLEDAAEDAAKQVALPPNAHIVDVRGGEGVFLNEILERHTQATGTLVDLPVSATAQSNSPQHLASPTASPSSANRTTRRCQRAPIST
ncbi:siderophore-interacting protein [Devosia sp. 2618]|uniref:siderophore-interacting protein n=1 Tax=Devosia sp. 2618 TaxID=3156454 RepID=UPI0033949388